MMSAKRTRLPPASDAVSHRGAIEGLQQRVCFILLGAFSVFDCGLHAVPGKLLDVILGQIDELSEASVTRRSAGCR